MRVGCSGRSGDGGIDGIIKEDPLGLDVIYIQAKRWEAGLTYRNCRSSQVPPCRDTVARKGVVFITTSTFTKDAEEYVGKAEYSKIILIDGPTLARLMVDNLVGVSSVRSYGLLKADPDYFTEE